MADLPRLSGPSLAPKDGAKPEQLIILCHGYGANGDDLIGLAPQLGAVMPKAQFVAPNAPEPCGMVPGGYQWFPLTTMSREERRDGTYRAAPILDAFIDAELAEHGLDESRLALIGFSQGTMMALHVGLRRAKPPACIVGFSGSLTAPERLIDEITVRPPVLLIHGDRDNVVPFPMMFEAAGALEAAGVTVDRHLSQGVAHGIAPDGLHKAMSFLARQFG